MTTRLATALCAALLLGCGSSDPPHRAAAAAPTATATAAARPDRFDSARAWSMLAYQVHLGPRPAGSAKAKQLAAYIKRRLPHAHYEAVPGGLRNVVGELPGKGKAIALAAHYDTKDLPGFVGAEDGAGGTAEMLEIARDLRTVKRAKDAPPIRFLAFDGEEATDDSDFLGTGVRGSKAYAARHASELKALILLDFVADKDLSIPRDASSDPVLWAKLRSAAQKVGSGINFPDETQGVVEDDHTPFLEKGVPSIDLIDFSFPCWHKTCDDLSAVSAASLDRSGEAVLELLRTLR